MSSVPAIQTVDVHKRYGATHALRGVSLTVGRGEVFGFLGPNGAGKSTIVKIILGLVQASGGEVRVLGHPAGSLQARRAIGFLPETFRFQDWMRASELMDFHGRIAGVARKRRRRRGAELLSLVGLGEHANQRLSTFSKGMQQRVGLAQALISDPPVVILDEPTSALDPIGRREVRDLIRSLRSTGTTVFLNSHLLSEIELVCDRVAVITHGSVVASGALAELLRPRQVALRLGGGAGEALESVRDEFGDADFHDGRYTLPVSEDAVVAMLVKRMAEAGVPIYDVQLRSETLEDLFVRLAQTSEQ